MAVAGRKKQLSRVFVWGVNYRALKRGVCRGETIQAFRRFELPCPNGTMSWYERRD